LPRNPVAQLILSVKLVQNVTTSEYLNNLRRVTVRNILNCCPTVPHWLYWWC